MSKTKSMEKCTNCGKEIKGGAIASPTIDKKRRNQCLACAEKELSMESRKVRKKHHWEIDKDLADYPICILCGIVKQKKNKPCVGIVKVTLRSQSMESRFEKKFVDEFGLKVRVTAESLRAFIRNEKKLTRQANDKKILSKVKDRVDHCHRTGASGEVTMAYINVYENLKRLLE